MTPLSINTDTCASIAIEPTYFDKTADYPTGCPDNKYLLTVQNCSATLDEDGKIQIVTEDIRNGNGRAIKSKLWSPNRVDKIDAPVNAIFWIMKDPTLPPVVKLKGASLASVMGATLATKRSSAERLAPGVDPNKLVVVPYANPFRTYPLANDYAKFKKLVEEKNVDCYIVNTGDFMGKKVQPKDTLGILEAIVEGKAEFKHDLPLYAADNITDAFGNVITVKGGRVRSADRTYPVATVYVGVKGDANLDFAVDSKDATLVLSWYSAKATSNLDDFAKSNPVFSNSNLIGQYNAEGTIVPNEGADMNLDKLAAFLADVTNEIDSNNYTMDKIVRTIDSKDASFILAMYSEQSTTTEKGAATRELWNKVLEGSPYVIND